MKKPLLALFLSFAAALSAEEAVTPVTIGAKAPPLASGKFVQGEPVTAFEEGKTYMVEFWATWCGPCIANIPHLNELQNKFADKGFVVIGQNIMERDESKVEPFIKEMGDKMQYRVALDDKSAAEQGKMYETWFKAAGQNGIPSAIIVDKTGTVVWIGHPASLDEATIGQILEGTFDSTAMAAKLEKEQAAAARQQALRPLLMEIQSLAQKGEVDAALKKIDEFSEKESAQPETKQTAAFLKLELYFLNKNGKGVSETAAELPGILPEEMTVEQKSMMLNQISWILTTKAAEFEGLDKSVAVKLAETSAELSERKQPAILDTLARSQFVNGDKDAAIATAKEALTLVTDDDAELKTSIEATIASYEKGELPVVE